MRMINFRAWDKKKKIMLKVLSIGLKYYESGEPIGMGYSERPEDDIELMQFTGLTDKNGVEIYEGDLFGVVNKGTEMLGEIYFEEGCFKMKYGYRNPKKDQRKDYFLSSVIENSGAKIIEIIGNIYENKELLK